MSIAERASGTVAAVVRWVGPLLRRVRRYEAGILAERGAAASGLATWGRSRPPGPLVWLHGASAGELLSAVPAVQALRRRIDLQLLVTHFSPSGAGALSHLGADHSGYPPLDTRRECERALAALRPSALVYAKLDVWPGLTGAASRAGIPVGMVNAIVRGNSRRMRPLARALMRPTYAGLSLVGAASEEDAERLRRLGVRREALRLTGDAAFDLAIARADRARGEGGARDRFEAWLPPRPRGGTRLVAGSTWPEDEDALLSALYDPTARGRCIQIVFAPHRPTGPHLARLLDACKRRGARAVRWSEIARDRWPRGVGRSSEPEAADGRETAAAVIVFDEVGSLAELYTAADIAYVGGGLGGGGLHNVLEPAAAAVPVLFGPRHDRRDAADLITSGGGIAVDADSLRDVIEALLDEENRGRIGERARRYVESRCGAGQAGAELMLQLIEART